MDVDAEPLDTRSEQGGGCHDAHAGAERIEQEDVGSRHAGMQDIAANRNF